MTNSERTIKYENDDYAIIDNNNGEPLALNKQFTWCIFCDDPHDFKTCNNNPKNMKNLIIDMLKGGNAINFDNLMKDLDSENIRIALNDLVVNGLLNVGMNAADDKIYFWKCTQPLVTTTVPDKKIIKTKNDFVESKSVGTKHADVESNVNVVVESCVGTIQEPMNLIQPDNEDAVNLAIKIILALDKLRHYGCVTDFIVDIITSKCARGLTNNLRENIYNSKYGVDFKISLNSLENNVRSYLNASENKLRYVLTHAIINNVNSFYNYEYEYEYEGEIGRLDKHIHIQSAFNEVLKTINM